MTVEVAINTRIVHLDGITIYGFTKQKLNLSLDDNSNSHSYNCVSFIIFKLEKVMSPTKSSSFEGALKQVG